MNSSARDRVESNRIESNFVSSQHQPAPQLPQNVAEMGLRKDRIGIGTGETATEGETGTKRGRAGGRRN